MKNKDSYSPAEVSEMLNTYDRIRNLNRPEGAKSYQQHIPENVRKGLRRNSDIESILEEAAKD